MMAVDGMAMDVDNDKKRSAPSPKRPSSKHRPKKDGTQQDIEMKEAKAPHTMLRISLEDKPNFSGLVNNNNLMTQAREGLSDSNFKEVKAMLHGAG